MNELGTIGPYVQGRTALHLAAAYSTKKAVIQLLSKKEMGFTSPLAATDADCRTPLHLAAMHDRTDIVKVMMERGGNPAETDKWGKSPITIAVENGASM